jgi:hypothetical protein
MPATVRFGWTSRWLPALALCTLSLGSCENPPTDRGSVLAPAASPSASTRDEPNVSVRWNATARSLVGSHNTNGPAASRVYALVSVAQFVAATDADRRGARGKPSDPAPPARPSVRGAIAKASWSVLSALFTDAASRGALDAQLSDDETAPLPPNEKHTDVGAGETVGAAAAAAVLARAATDGAALADCPSAPPGPPSAGFWFDDAVPPNPQPLLPCFGKVKAWLFSDIAQFRAGPPPPFGSPAFLSALAEVRAISDTRSAEQLATIDRWLDGNNTVTPPGHWNAIAADLIGRDGVDEREAARVFALLNIAEMDAHIACWDRKYTYWRLRPWQADPLITTPRGRPHHPSNPSGHACAGGAGSSVLAGLFPKDRERLLAMGEEEGFSTVLSGGHFRYDIVDGIRISSEIGAAALELGRRDDAILALVNR